MICRSCCGVSFGLERSGLAREALDSDAGLELIRAAFEDACHVCLFLRLKTDIAIC